MTITTQAGRAVADRDRDSGTGQTTPEATPSGPGRQQRRPPFARITPRALWALTALALVAAAVLAATGGRSWYAAQQLSAAQAEAEAAGRQLAVNFVDLNYETVDEDTARVKAGATGDFLKSYSEAAAGLKKAVVENKSVSTVERIETGLVSGDQDSAVVIAGVVAPTKNTAVPKGEKKTYRMKLGLEKAGDEWKVASLEFVG
jgi:Mce-associated membrane protein